LRNAQLTGIQVSLKSDPHNIVSHWLLSLPCLFGTLPWPMYIEWNYASLSLHAIIMNNNRVKYPLSTVYSTYRIHKVLNSQGTSYNM
jgi:hypothetical protein